VRELDARRRSIALTGLAVLVTTMLLAGSATATGAAGAKSPKRTSTLRATALDTTAPTKPGRLTITASTPTSLTLTWRKSNDRFGVAGYIVYRNDVRFGYTNASTLRYIASSLPCGTSHLLGVEAYDLAGNRSARATIIGATGACTDTQAPTAPGGLAQTDVSSSSISFSWSPSSDNFGVVGYEVLRDGSVVGSTASTLFALTALQCGTMYTLGVRALDAAGNRSPASTILSTTTSCPDTTSPTAPSSLALAAATETSVTVTWRASSDDRGVIGYGVFSDTAFVGSTAATSYTVGGLLCGTSHVIAVDAYDAAGNRSGRASITTSTSPCPAPAPAPPPADTSPPSTPSGLAVTGATASSISLRWNASTDNTGVAGYGLYRDNTGAGSSSQTSTTFSGLACGRSYTLAVDAYDAAGNRSGRGSLVSSTSPCPDTTPPSAPSGLTQTGATETTVGLGWTASTDNVGVAGYGVYLGGVRVATTSSPGYTFGSLACGSTYTVGVDAYDAAGGRSAQRMLVVTTQACPSDGQSPTVPQNQTVGGFTQSSFTMSWSAASDNVGVAGYRAYLNGAVVGTTTSTSYTYTGLSCSTTYTVGLTAFDAAGNASDVAYASGPASTTACAASGDTTPPSAPSGVSVSGATQSSLTLSWSQSADNVAVTGYGYYRNGTLVGNGSGTSYTFGGLSCGTTYSLAVDAYDAAGNRSAKASVSGSTSACSTAPPTGGTTINVAPGGNLVNAYNSLPDGGVIQLQAGNYGNFTTPGGSKRITVRGVYPGTVLTGLGVMADNLTVENIEIDNGGAAETALYLDGVKNFSFKHGEVHRSTNAALVLLGGSGTAGEMLNPTFDDVYFHDAIITDPNVHMECMWTGASGLTILNSRFENCAVMDVFITRGSWWNQPLYGGVRVENTYFDAPRFENGRCCMYYSLAINSGIMQEIRDYTIKNNHFVAPPGGYDTPQVGTNVFCGNTGQAPASWRVPCT
jgi:chitodextrinase